MYIFYFYYLECLGGIVNTISSYYEISTVSRASSIIKYNCILHGKLGVFVRRKPWHYCRRLVRREAGALIFKWSQNSETALEGETDFASDCTHVIEVAKVQRRLGWRYRIIPHEVFRVLYSVLTWPFRFCRGAECGRFPKWEWRMVLVSSVQFWAQRLAQFRRCVPSPG
jgi:hypothetical protein